MSLPAHPHSRHEPRAQGGYWYANAVWNSDLPSPARLVALILNGKADNSTGRIQEPLSLNELARRTGLSRRTVATHLNTLEEGGWVHRDRPEKWKLRSEYERTAYTVTIPQGYPQASARAALGLVQELPVPSARAAHSFTKRTNARAAGAAAPPPPRAGTNPRGPDRGPVPLSGHGFAGNDETDCDRCHLPLTHPRHRHA